MSRYDQFNADEERIRARGDWGHYGKFIARVGLAVSQLATESEIYGDIPEGLTLDDLRSAAKVLDFMADAVGKAAPPLKELIR